MSIAIGLILTMVIVLLMVGSLIGYVVLTLSMSKTSKKYREFVRELKKQNRYEEWSERHTRLVKGEKVFQYGGVLGLVALLLYIGIVKDFIEAPRAVLVISAVLFYLFWPFCFVSTLVISRLYKEVPELWSELK